MAMKFRITKKQFEALSEELQEHYDATADGKNYELDVAGLPEADDTDALKRARDREKERADNLKEELEEVQGELNTIKKGQTTGEKDVARVTERYEKKLTKAQEEAEGRVQKMRDRVAQGMIETAASAMATKVSNAPKLFVEHASKRMEVVFGDDDTPVLKFKDKDGKVSDTMKVEDLEKELVADKDLSAIIVANRARGSGAPPVVDPLKVGSADTEKPTDLMKADTKSLTEQIRAKVQAKHEAAGTA